MECGCFFACLSSQEGHNSKPQLSILLIQYILQIFYYLYFLIFYTEEILYSEQQQTSQLQGSMKSEGQTNPLITPIYKSYAKLLLICINASLSAFFVGYSLVYMGALSVKDFEPAIIQHYGFNQITWIDKVEVYKSIIQGAVPIGAIVGALSASLVISRFSRRNGFLLVNIPAFLSIVLMVYIKHPYSFLIMRFIQGICTGIFSTIVPLYINEIVTPDCTNLGSLNQVFIAFAQLFCFVLSFVLHSVLETGNKSDRQSIASTTWKIISQFPLIIIVIQTIVFIFVFPYETPKYLYEKGLRQEAADLIAIIYREQHAEDALARYSGMRSVSQQQRSMAVEQSLVGVANRIQIKRNVKLAVIFAIHLALLQQLSGVNAIVIYGKNTFEEALQDDTAVGWATIGLTGAPFLSAIATIKLMNIKGRKFLIQIGTLICAVCLAAVGAAFLLKGGKDFDHSVIQSITIIIGMCVFMAVFGLTLGPIVWLYIPEIVESNIIPYSTMANLLGAAACTIGFPLITNPELKYIPFMFFFIWCLISLIFNQKIMVQTKDRARERVFEEFRSKRLC